MHNNDKTYIDFFSEHGDVGSSASGQDQPSLSEESHNSGSGSATENHQSATSEESDTEKGDAPGKKTVLSVANTFTDDSNGTDDDDSKDITKSRTAAIRDIIRVSRPKRFHICLLFFGFLCMIWY